MLMYPAVMNDDVPARPGRPECPFCEMPAGRVVASNDLAFALRDAYPVTPLHTLVIPRRHVRGCFELTPEEVGACWGLLLELREGIAREDAEVAGFNVGINDGEAAGQTVAHCHLHLIPRRRGDVGDPRGGVRGVIPGRAGYP